MIRTIPWVLLLVVATATTNSFAQELLQDPSFDATDVTAQTNPFWTLDVNFPGDGAEPAARYQDAPWASNPAGVAGIGIWNRAFDGTLDNPAEAAIFQNVPGSAGVQYRASGFYRRELHFTSLATVLGMNFMQGDTILETAVHDLGSAPTDGTWNEYEVIATAPAGTDTVQVFGRMIQGVVGPGNPQSSMFDDFSLTVVPEPTSAFLALLCACGLASMRRR